MGDTKKIFELNWSDSYFFLFRVQTVKASPAHNRHEDLLLSYTELMLIGRGAFGKVVKAVLTHNGQVII